MARTTSRPTANFIQRPLGAIFAGTKFPNACLNIYDINMCRIGYTTQMMPHSSDVGWWMSGLTYVHYYPNLSSHERKKKNQMELETIENGISCY